MSRPGGAETHHGTPRIGFMNMISSLEVGIVLMSAGERLLKKMQFRPLQIYLKHAVRPVSMAHAHNMF